MIYDNGMGTNQLIISIVFKPFFVNLMREKLMTVEVEGWTNYTQCF